MFGEFPAQPRDEPPLALDIPGCLTRERAVTALAPAKRNVHIDTGDGIRGPMEFRTA